MLEKLQLLNSYRAGLKPSPTSPEQITELLGSALSTRERWDHTRNVSSTKKRLREMVALLLYWKTSDHCGFCFFTPGLLSVSWQSRHMGPTQVLQFSIWSRAEEGLRDCGHSVKARGVTVSVSFILLRGLRPSPLTAVFGGTGLAQFSGLAHSP